MDIFYFETVTTLFDGYQHNHSSNEITPNRPIRLIHYPVHYVLLYDIE